MSDPTAQHPLAELVKARLREFLREKGMIFWVFVFPLLMAIGLGIAFRSRPPEPIKRIFMGEGRTAVYRVRKQTIMGFPHKTRFDYR